MKYVAILSYVNGDVRYIGPFDNEAVAAAFMEGVSQVHEVLELTTIARWFIKPLTTPELDIH